MNRIVLLLLVCFPMLVQAGPICGNCKVHKVLPSVAAGDPNNGSLFHPNDLEFSFFNPTPPEPQFGKGKLLVFLPGAGTKTAAYTNFAEVAANHGYHVVVVSYWNEYGTRHLCGPNMGCYGPVRNEVFDGTPDPTWSVNGRMQVACVNGPPPAICNQTQPYFSDRDTVQRRLLQLIHHLHNLPPPNTENWGQFLVDPNCKPGKCELAWSKVVLAGHSNGSGEAAFIATQHDDVARIIMISGVDDEPATWTMVAPAHPEKYFGLAHLCDHSFYASSLHNWDHFNLPGTPTFIESGQPAMVPTTAQNTCATAPSGTTSTRPYGQSHRLVSGFMNCTSPPHDQVAVNCTSEPDVLLNAWRFMLTASVTP